MTAVIRESMKASHDERVPHQEHPSDQFPGGPTSHNQFSGIRHGVLGRALRGARARLVSAAEPHLRAGCGEPDARTLPRPGLRRGADAIWLATQGWQATGYDISQTAIGRAQQAAAEKNVADTTHFEAVNLDEWSAGAPA